MPVTFDRELGPAARITNMEGQTQKPALFEAIARRQDERDKAEHARLLYVAMTRARDWLLLSGTPEPPKGSWLAYLDRRHELATREEGAVWGNGIWQARMTRQVPAGCISPTSQSAAAPLPDKGALEARIQAVPEMAGRRSTFSVSELLDQMCPKTYGDSYEVKERPLDALGIGPVSRGDLVHRLFEVWRVEDEPGTAIDTILRRECPRLGSKDEIAACLAKAAHEFQASACGRKVLGGSKVQREAPFVMRLGAALVRGTVDIVLGDNTVVDYKTGKPDPATMSRYEHQLRLYAAALEQLRGAEVPAAFIYLVDRGESLAVDVTPAAIAATLELARQAIESLAAE